MKALNQAITEEQNLGPGFMIGHSYFCGNGAALTEKGYEQVFATKSYRCSKSIGSIISSEWRSGPTNWERSSTSPMTSIPVANIYYLLCYAWDEFAPRQIDRFAAEKFPDTLHLFSRQLIIGIQSLHQRGLETGYIPLEGSTSAPRGRILIASSIRAMTTRPRKLYCTFDEMQRRHSQQPDTEGN